MLIPCMLIRMALLIAPQASAAEPFPPDHPLRSEPRLDPVDEARLHTPELLATPEMRVLLGYTRRPLHLQDGHTMAVFSYSNSAPANWIFLFNAHDFTHERYAMPHNDIASHAAALGADGHIYIMPYAKVRAFKFDATEKTFTEFTSPLPEEEYTWDAFGASNGRIYFGTWPNACFGEYDPATGQWDIRKQIIPDAKYVTTFREDAEGGIHFRAWGPANEWLRFDPETRTFSPSSLPEPAPSGPMPPMPEGDTGFTAVVETEGRRFAVSNPSGRFWEIVSGALRDAGNTGRPAEPLWWFKTTPGAVSGVSYYGALFRYDLSTGAMRHGQLDNTAPGANAIMFLETITPECVIGANYSQQNLFAVHPETGAVRASEGVVARVSGEPMCAVGFGGKAYLGIYISSIISIYDPAEPFEYGVNPRELIQLGPTYKQTRPRAAVTNGRVVCITSDSEYNCLGGAMVVVHPAAGHIDVIHHLIRDQNLPTLAYDPLTGLAWGGTDRWGQMRSHPPTQESALIYAFDPETQRVETTLTPWPGADVVSVHGVSHNGVLLASCEGEIALIHAARREILYKGPFSLGVPGSIGAAVQGDLRRGSDGLSYVLLGGNLYAWDFQTNVLRLIARTEGCRTLTEPSPGTWLLANGPSVFRLRLGKPRHP